MKMVFKVTIHLKDRSHNDYRIVAKDDCEAREKAEKMESQAWKDFGEGKPYPGTAFCETELVCELDAI